ncbi:hypothetical protein [Nocardia sp. NPDC058666]|uniref:hypothetical protein n=1 Tax=Nocardia sp. NPDC058666 TaxID=3346587 RepID=UPI0036613C55
MHGDGDWWATPGPGQANGHPGYQPQNPGYPSVPGYQPSNGPVYPGSPAPGYFPNMPPGQQIPRPHAPQRRSSAGTATVVLIGAVVMVLLVVGAVMYTNSRGTDPEQMATMFPGLVQPTGGVGGGYADQSCWHETSGDKLRAPDNDTLRLGDWTDAWDCWGHVSNPGYVVLAYPEHADVMKVVQQLPPNKVSYSSQKVAAYSWQTPDTATPMHFWKLHAFTDEHRNRFIVLAHEKYWPVLEQGKDLAAFDLWCQAMPFD